MTERDRGKRRLLNERRGTAKGAAGECAGAISQKCTRSPVPQKAAAKDRFFFGVGFLCVSVCARYIRLVPDGGARTSTRCMSF